MCDKSLCNCRKKGASSADKVDPEVMRKLEDGYANFSKAESKSLLKKYLTPEVFNKLKGRKTSFGSSLLDVVQSGFANPDSGVGLYACDPDAYGVFAELFDPVIEDYHEGFKPSDIHPCPDWGNPDNLPCIDPEGKFVVSTRVRCGRSLKGFPLNPTMTKDHYLEIQQKLCHALCALKGELKGKYHPLEGMDKTVQQQMIDDHFLFKEGDRFLQAANSNRFWPIGRGIFFSENKKFLAWVNEEDHLRAISMQMGGDLAAVYKRLVQAVKALSSQLEFARHKRLGFITFCPSNLGTTIRASVHIKLPKLSANYEEFEKIAKQYNLQVRGTSGEHSESVGGVYDVSNKRRMGLTEYQALQEMASGIQEMIRREEALG